MSRLSNLFICDLSREPVASTISLFVFANIRFLALCNVKCCSCKQQVAELWCRDCKSKGFCRECYEMLHQQPALSDHQPSESKPPKIVNCTEHPTKEAEFWCEENEALYCSKCLVKKQKQHKCESIADAVTVIIDRVSRRSDHYY